MPGNKFVIEINPQVPEGLSHLAELARDLWYSWHRPTRALFRQLNPNLWKRTGHNPRLFLRSVDQKHLEKAADDQVFMAAYNQVLSAYDTYHNKDARCASKLDFKDSDLVAYFCAEYGFHESFPIYSGGLGILSGDHCKTASDMRLPFIGIGLLYRQGYFSQRIDEEGNQIALYHDSNLDDLPVSPVLGKGGEEIRVSVDMPGREVMIKVWQAVVGQVTLYLMV
ncbi:MAG: glycosyltransferase family 1 protein [Gammaproteobacteria bacterium]|nr:glycosyltransferase family 1 protein [Gammaproteobacteria bacterium]